MTARTTSRFSRSTSSRSTARRTTSGAFELTPDALDLLAEYDWPGNVRELENVIERAVVLCVGTTIGPELVPEHVRATRPFQIPHITLPPEGIPLKEVIGDFERRLIESTLEAAGGVQKRAAELLHIKPTTLNEMIKRYDIRPRRSRRPLTGAGGDVSLAPDAVEGHEESAPDPADAAEPAYRARIVEIRRSYLLRMVSQR